QGQEVIFFLLLELQSTVDFQMPYRLLLYLVEIWRDFLKNTPPNEAERKEFLLPSVIPLVLYNGEAPWTAKQTFGEYLSGGELFEEYLLNFRYFLIDVHRYTEEELLTLSNLIGAVFYLDQENDGKELIRRLKKIIGFFRDMPDELIILFMHWIKFAFSAKVPRSLQESIRKIINESKPNEVNTMISNLAKTLEEMEQKAEKRGEMKKAKIIVRQMLRKGMDEELIAELTGLSREEVEKMKEKND
ncbi:MAG: Rpn family recombination-promoting nuclease/putative transposase, partial [Candidatus Atribacteria bacterium]|nr:Rpn family recombination-promoting nuclease/putative transposase [Candidatus Atribacteria bacterium]